MLTKFWRSISTKANDVVQILGHYYEEVLEPAPTVTLHPTITPLPLPARPDVRILLLRAMVPTELSANYARCFDETIDRMEASLNAQYVEGVSRLCKSNSSATRADTPYVQAFQSGLLALYNQGVQQVLLGLQSRLGEHDPSFEPTISTHTLLPSSPPTTSHPVKSGKSRCGRPHVFSKEQKAVLQALLAYDDQFSSAEKELIAQNLNLTREQVNRWFCNARARGGRKKPYEKPISRAQRQAIDHLASSNCHQSQNQRSSSISSSDVSSNTQYSSSLASSDDVEMSLSDCQTDAPDQSPFLTATLSPLCPDPDIPFAPLHSQAASSSPLLGSGHDLYPTASSSLSTYGLLHSNDSSSSQSTCSSSDSLSHDGPSSFFSTEFTNDISSQYDPAFTFGDPLSTFSEDPLSFLQPQLIQQQDTPEYWQEFWNQL
ncbi:hypothetical protein CROQUDRAFT_661468 [Cronartium quercuum f. sp. fusiforme G11]|uniref:Homeobox domain-containing protein n=1 Tax=Cronartium quercuum f. sp. fusiforme G11 TaxID=708437 RepID=A0A9P6TA74_9BASI|nr:hypothetical protein CROQUDRAFT_661468 [Cronartium quercuum f. sp. fusiforme G11]